MVYLIVILVGLVGLRFLPIDLLPEIEFPRIGVQTSYPNVGPEEIELLITQPLENAISGAPNMTRVTSFSAEGRSWVNLEFSRGTDLAEAANDIRDALDGVRNILPPDVDMPRIRKFDPDAMPIVIIGVKSFDHDLESLTRVVERDLVRRFEQLQGVGMIDVRGGVYREVRIDLYRDKLRASGLTARDVQQAIARESAIAPGGNVKDGLRDLYVRALADYETIQQISDAVVTYINDIPVRVGDVASVRHDFRDSTRLIELDGVPIVQFRIRKQSGANTVAMARAVRAEIARVHFDRNDVQLKIVSDHSNFIQQSIDNVKTAAVWGGMLAILVLYFFLRNGSSTFIIALAIPISLIATFGLLYFRELSLNQMTFGGLALGIGLIVDNAIVVLENIVRQREENKRDLKSAASIGTREVAGAIVASTLTSCVIFLPVVFMQTVTAVMFVELAMVVVFSLFCSLLVALTLVPVLASRFLNTNKHKAGGRNQCFLERFSKLEYAYSQWLVKAIQWRWIVFGVAASLVVGAWFLARLVSVELAPETDANEIRIQLRMDEGTNLAVVQHYMRELEEVVARVVNPNDIINMSADIWRGQARIDLTLPNPDERRIHSAALADQIRREVQGEIPGVQVSVRAQSGLWMLRRLFSGGGGDEAVQIQLMGYDQAQALSIGQQIRGRIESILGVIDVRIGGEEDEGQPEQRIRLDRDRIAAMGLTVQEVAQSIQLNIGGGRAGRYREGSDEYDIRVRLRPEDRLTVLDLENISVRAPQGGTIPLSAVTYQERARSNAGIRRINGQRVTFISANLESGMPLGNAVAAIRSELRDMPLPQGFSIVFGGEFEEQQRAQRDFTLAILLALALIYMVMAGQFERFLDSLIVMCAVPLALVGVVPTLWLTQTTFNIQSLMGLIMLIGIVVNNAIVLVDYINLMRREHGLEIQAAVVEAGRLRLRPILMTTVTTILGLCPLALGLGAGGEIQAALARTVVGGLAASTLITLVLIPVLYISIHRLKDQLAPKLRSTFKQSLPALTSSDVVPKG